MLNANEISKIIIGAAIEVHRQLGPGLLESSYLTCLIYELRLRGLDVKSQIALPLIYKDIKMDIGYGLDILVNDMVIIEVKSVEALTEVHTAQVVTYLKITGCEIGLLVNFNVALLKNGIKRIIRTQNNRPSLDLKVS